MPPPGAVDRHEADTEVERIFVWLGGMAFAGSLAYAAHAFVVTWGRRVDISGTDAVRALIANAVLVGIFAAHHSLFARAGIKQRLTRFIPPQLVRSSYVWVASGLLCLVVALWRPVGGELYHVSGWLALVPHTLQVAGLWLIGAAVRHINPLELAGIRPAAPDAGLLTSGPYRLVRHPLYLGWVLLVFGGAHLTGDRLAFAVLTTAYIILAIPWEERSLAANFGEAYGRYQDRVRWRLVPFVY
jgi:protein-S-isoprenylcysteine O-methyltransferase Ste14